MIVKILSSTEIQVRENGASVTIQYPSPAGHAYEFIRDCVERFNREPQLSEDPPKIYVWGIMCRPIPFLYRLAKIAEAGGAKVTFNTKEGTI